MDKSMCHFDMCQSQPISAGDVFKFLCFISVKCLVKYD